MPDLLDTLQALRAERAYMAAEIEAPCPACHDTDPERADCPMCDGVGRVTRPRSWWISVAGEAHHG
jgi:hypothetical protein